jgi:hypothetical protein
MSAVVPAATGGTALSAAAGVTSSRSPRRRISDRDQGIYILRFDEDDDD